MTDAKRALGGLALVLATGIAACDRSSTQPPQSLFGSLSATAGARLLNAPSEAVVSVVVTGLRNPMAIGGFELLKATAVLSDNTHLDVTNLATWVSGDPTVFTVSSTGVLSPVGKGLTGIQASYQGVSSPIVMGVVDQPGCTYQVSPAAVTFQRGINSASSNVTTQPGCAWTVSSDVDWMSVTLFGATPGVGSGSFSYTVSFRDGPLVLDPRIGRAMVRWDTPTAGQNVLVTQTSACQNALFDFKPGTSSVYGPAGGTGHLEAINTDSVFGYADPGKNPWTIRSTVDWIVLTFPAPDTWSFGANGSDIHFTVNPNPDASPRVGTLVSCNATWTVTQAGR